MRLRKHKLPTRIRRVIGNALLGTIYGESFTESLSPVESLTLDIGALTALAEGVAPVEVLSYDFTAGASLAESLFLVETLSSSGDFNLSLAETVAGTGTIPSTTFTSGVFGAIQISQDGISTSVLSSGLALTGGGAQGVRDVSEALQATLNLVVSLAESVTTSDTFDTVPEVILPLGDVVVVGDTLSEAVVHAATLAETVVVSDTFSVPEVYAETLADFITVGEDLEVDTGIVPVPELPVHWGGIGGPGPLPSLLGLARGADLVVRLVLEPGIADGVVVLGAVAQGADLSVVAGGDTRTKKATVQGDGSLGIKITLDSGCAFGVVDWSRHNEEILLVLAA